MSEISSCPARRSHWEDYRATLSSLLLYPEWSWLHVRMGLNFIDIKWMSSSKYTYVHYVFDPVLPNHFTYMYMTLWDFVIHFWQCPNWDGNAWPSQCHMKVFESQPHSHGFLSGINEIRNHPSHLVRPPYAVINAHLSASYLRDLIESLIVKQWVCFEFGHSLKQRNRRELELGCEGSTLWKSLVGGK